MKVRAKLAVVLMVIATAFQLTSCSSNQMQNTYNDATELWPAYSNGKYGYINKKGVFVIPAQYEGAYSFSGGYALVWLNDKRMFIDKNGKLQATPSYDYAYSFWNNYAVAELSDKYGLLNTNFEYVIQPIYYGLENAGSNGLCPAKLSSGDKWGYVNTKGESAIAAIYDDAYLFISDFAAVEMGDKTGIINQKGEYVIQPIYNWVFPVGNNRFVYRDEKTKLYGLLNEKGQVVVNPIYEDLACEGEIAYYGLDVTMYPAYRDGKAGFIDKDGNVKISFKYSWAAPFNEGYAVVELNDREMVIDEKDNIVLQFAENEWTDLGFLHNGLILTYKQGTYYYKDIKGNVVYAWTESSNNAPAKKMRGFNSHKNKAERTRLQNPFVYYLGQE